MPVVSTHFRSLFTVLYNVPGNAPFPNLPLPLGKSGTPPNTWFPGPTSVHIPNSMSIGSSVFVGLTVVNKQRLYNKQHVLHPTVPGTMDTKYHLGPRPHNFKLTAKNSLITECDFITRMLSKDVRLLTLCAFHCYFMHLHSCLTCIVLYSPLFYHGSNQQTHTQIRTHDHTTTTLRSNRPHQYSACVRACDAA